MKYCRFACKHCCFTLLELLLVIAIIAVFSASAISLVAARSESFSISDIGTAADKLFVFLQSARVQAIRNGLAQEVFWDAETHCWKMSGPAEKELKMPETVKVRIVDLSWEQESIIVNYDALVEDLPGQNLLSFYPSGDLEPKQILLEDPEGRFICFRFSAMTGEIYKETKANSEELQNIKKIVPIQGKEL